MYAEIYQSSNSKKDPNLGSIAVTRLTANSNTDLKDIISQRKKRNKTPKDFKTKPIATKANSKIIVSKKNSSLRLDIPKRVGARKTPDSQNQQKSPSHGWTVADNNDYQFQDSPQMSAQWTQNNDQGNITPYADNVKTEYRGSENRQSLGSPESPVKLPSQ